MIFWSWLKIIWVGITRKYYFLFNSVWYLLFFYNYVKFYYQFLKIVYFLPMQKKGKKSMNIDLMLQKRK